MGRQDLFISCDWPDRNAVGAVGERLQAPAISSFIDREHRADGVPSPQAREQASNDVAAVAVFIGFRGFCFWQKREIGFALDRQVQEERTAHSFRFIPILLRGADPTPVFLFLNAWVDLREELGNAEVLDALARAVRGEPTARSEEARAVRCSYRALNVLEEANAAFSRGCEAFNTSSMAS